MKITSRQNLDLKNYQGDIEDFRIMSSGMFNKEYKGPIFDKPLYFTGILPKTRRKSNGKNKVPTWKQ